VKLSRATLTVGVTVALAAAVVVQQFVTAWSPAGGAYQVKALVADAGGVARGSGVYIVGLRVGRVSAIDRTGGQARLTLSIDDDYGRLPADSRLALKLRTLIGETAVNILPGRDTTTLPDGGVLSQTQTEEDVDVDQILDVLKGQTRARAQQTIAAMSRGIGGRGAQVNSIVRDASGVVKSANDLYAVLKRDRGELARLVDNVGDVSRAVGDRGQALRQLGGGLRTTFGAVAHQDSAVRRTLAELPSVLRETESTSETLMKTSGNTGRVLSNAAGLINQLNPTLGQLTPAAKTGRRLMQELARSAAPLEGTLGKLRSLSGPAAGALPQLRSVLCQVTPMTEYLKPYGPELAAVFSNMGSSTNFYDATGHAARIMPLVNDDALSTFDEPTSKAVDALLRVGLLQKTRQRGYNAYPKPGDAGPPSTGDGLLGFSDAAKHQPYRRIHAAC
jgi:phospholipid/cholesterol/gamma-HCH transport system substrate-binding protein